MSTTAKAVRVDYRRQVNVVSEVLEDDDFVQGVLESLEAERQGAVGKTIQDIRRENGLTH